MLRATKPEAKEKRLKMFVYGPAGVGKTVAALQFPNAYIIDTEKGTDFYSGIINRSHSAVSQTLNPDDIKDELKSLLTEKHNYKTLIIDPVTQVYNAIQEKWTRIFEANAKSEKEAQIGDFGMRYWGKVKGEFKAIQRILLQLDMNVIVTSHQKDVYGGGFSKIGVTFDSMKGDDYFFDLVFRLVKEGEKRNALTEKERAEPGLQKFPLEFEWSYENFCKFYGREILEKDAAPVLMATEEQVERIKQLVTTVRLDEETINKWFTKADVNNWDEMTTDQISNCIDFVEKKIKGVSVAGQALDEKNNGKEVNKNRVKKEVTK